MADTSIGNVYPTNIPGYEDAADIQAALRTYHYGSSSYDSTNSNTAAIVNPSIAYHFKDIQNQIDDINALGTGSIVSNTQPTVLEEGLLWLDIDSQPSSGAQYPGAVYTTTAPSSPTDGTLWVEKGSSPLTMYIWNSTTSNWDEIGA